MGNRLLTILLAILLLVVIVGGAVIYFFVLAPRFDVSVTYQIPELFMTDLAGRGHIRVEIYAELGDKRLTKDFEKKQIEVVDAVYRVLRNKTREDLSGANGQDTLREDLLVALRQVLASDNVRNLYFKQIVID